MKFKVEEIRKATDEGCSLVKDIIEDVASVMDVVRERFTKPQHDEMVRFAGELKKSLGTKGATAVMSTFIGAESIKRQSVLESASETLKTLLPLASLAAQMHQNGRKSIGDLFGWALEEEAN